MMDARSEFVGPRNPRFMRLEVLNPFSPQKAMRRRCPLVLFFVRPRDRRSAC